MIIITPRDRIGYIRRNRDGDGKQQFQFIEEEITKTVASTGDEESLIYSKSFHAIKMSDLTYNTKVANRENMVIINEPFITNDELSERCRKYVDHWNKYGTGSVFA